MSGVRVMGETPEQYVSRMGDLAAEQLQEDAASLRSWLSFAADRRLRELGEGWTGAALLDAIARAEEAAATEPSIVASWRDGVLTFADGRDGLSADMVRALFGQASRVVFEGAGRERAGQGAAPAGRSIREWWARGHGSPDLRSFLSEYALGAAVQEKEHDAEADPDQTDGWDQAQMWADLKGLAIELNGQDLEIDGNVEGGRYALIDSTDRPAGVLRTFDAGSESDARAATVAAVSETHQNVTLATWVGTIQGDEPLDEADVYRGIATYYLLHEDRGVASLLDRAAESLCAQYSGRILRAAEQDADEMTFPVVCIEAGMTLNGSFYPRDLLRDKGVVAMDGAPLEEIIIDPNKLDHLEDKVLRHFPDGITSVVVGQVLNPAFEDEGGRAPNSEQVQLIADALKMTPNEVLEQSKGRVVATVQFDETRRGTDAYLMTKASADRGTLDKHPQLSVDFTEAPYVGVYDPTAAREIVYRTDINTEKRATLTMVNKAAAAGRFLQAA